MKAKKIAIILSAVLGVTTLVPDYAVAAINNGWEKVNGSWYFYENGNKTYGWKQSGGVWYYLDSEGIMKTGWLKDGANWYYLNDNGSMATGWKQADGKWYYFNENGSMSTGWVKDNGNWYYLSYSGSMATGWKEINGIWYYFNDYGSMKTGWLNDRGTWYYLNSDGSMAHDTVIDGYTINSNGAWIRDNLQDENIAANTGEQEETDKKSYTFTEGINKFSNDSASIILSQEDRSKNSTYSPVSFYMALAVLSEGADNETKNEILNALNVNDAEKLSKECKKLYAKEIFTSKYGMCTLADSVWVDDDNPDVEFNEDTLKKIEEDYGAGVYKGDLQSLDNAKKISSWLLDHTGGLLGKNAEAFIGKPDAVMDIFNAVYFKDKWKTVFDKDNTYEGSFNLSDKSIVKTDFMSNNIYTKIYEGGNGYKSSSLDFENGHKMMFILPDEGKSPYDIINDSNKLNEALNSLSSDKTESQDVFFKVPKIKFSSNIDLNDCASKLGLANMYNPLKADFTKFSEKGDLSVSNIHQEATVSIDEDGGEAAAFTEIGITGSAYNPNVKSYDMILDKPFIFAITNNDNTPLFIGVVNNPTV